MDPLSPNLLVSSIYDTRTHEEKNAISRSYYELHAKEVLLTLSYRVAKREKLPGETIEERLESLQKFTSKARLPKAASSKDSQESDDPMDLDYEEPDAMQTDEDSDDSEEQSMQLAKKPRTAPADETGRL